MPACGSQCIFCDVPIRIDSYHGCSHACKYCFVYRNYDISKIKLCDGVQSVINFINGQRSGETRWCDWNIPLHWGGVSDPFQPCEKTYKRSLEILKVFAQYNYPFIVSTKSTLPLEEPYYSLFKKCNCVFQCSMVCPSLSKLEKGAPDFDERLQMMEKMSTIVPRTIVRCQPYILELHKEILEQIPRIAKAGVYGIVYEAIKMQKKSSGMIKNGADFVYPIDTLTQKFRELKKICHNHGLVFLSGENRLRGMGDSLTCCGCEGLPGFRVNKYNLNYYIHDPKQLVSTRAMELTDSSQCWRSLRMKTEDGRILKTSSFKEMMDIAFKDKGIVETYLGKAK